MKTSVLEASVAFFDQPFLKPLTLSSGLITQATEARVTVRVRVQGREASGRGSIYLSDLWAWPGKSPERTLKDAAMRGLCTAVANGLAELCGDEAHPLELGLRLHHGVMLLSAASGLPALAIGVCSSPFDAAIHDAVGRALGIPAFRFYDADVPIPSADKYFDDGRAIAAIRRLLREPVLSLPAWWIVSASDDLDGDLGPRIRQNGIRCFKVKILAKDNAEDARRTAEVFQAARSWCLDPVLSVDSNEGHPNADAVVDYLDRLEALDADAFRALAYLEQPTARDIVAHPFDWGKVGARKPVFLDEGLTSLDLLPAAEEQHWTGLALKTCKGHSFALTAAAWAAGHGMLLSLQDLTNPGFSAVHSFLFAAHVPTINGVELNSPQFTPAANQPWLGSYPDIFVVTQGSHSMRHPIPPGLGSECVDLL